MPQRFETLSDLLAQEFDDVIDVRSPAEFDEDHIPGAMNLPALSNEERAQVGTIYVQDSAFKARKIGAALVSRNVANHLESKLKNKGGGWRPLVYCWRGGQRSGSVATILKAVGWRAETIEGGYQSYRRLVHAALYKDALPHRFVLLDGNTGTAKTDLLARLSDRGIQTLDLEGLAGHRGSLLGQMPGPQPSQKAFESALATSLAKLDPTRPILVEAESSKIGDRILPPTLWTAMKSAERIEVRAPVPARAAYLVEAYAEVIADPDGLRQRIEILRRHRGGDVVAKWLALLDEGAHLDLAAALITQHYDPSYAKSRLALEPRFLARLDSDGLAPGDRDRLADRIAGVVDGITTG